MSDSDTTPPPKVISGVLNLASPGIQFGKHVTDRLIGHRVSELKRFSVADVDEVPDLHGMLIFNHVLGGLYTLHQMRYFANFLRRLVMSVRAYREAHEKLLACFDAREQTNERMKHYLAAIDRLETCIMKLYPGMLCIWAAMRSFAPYAPQPKPFLDNDGSDYDRLRILYNRIKHFDEDIVSYETTGATDAPIAPLWIEGEKINALHKGSQVSLSFEELAEILRCATVDANWICKDIVPEIEKRKQEKQAGKVAPP